MEFLYFLTLFVILFGSLYSLPIQEQDPVNPTQPQEVPLPYFLVGADDATINEFYDMLSGVGNLRDHEIDEQVEKWVNEQSVVIQQKYAEFKSQQKLRQTMAAAMHKKIVENLSQKARVADEEISYIVTNPQLVAEEKEYLIQKILQTLNPEERKELSSLIGVV